MTPSPLQLAPRTPLWLEFTFTLWVAVWVPFYWDYYGPQNFLWFCDFANFVIAVALWTGNRFLFSWQAVSVLLVQFVFTFDLLLGCALGTPPIGAAGYMFDPQYPVHIRALSLFHVVTPFLLLWGMGRFGYDRRALLAQTVTAWIILPICYFAFGPEKDINWVWGPFERPQFLMLSDLYFALCMVGYPLLLYWPCHRLLLWMESEWRPPQLADVTASGTSSPPEPAPDPAVLRERLTGTLLGTALGDALGLACEGMNGNAITRRFGRVDRFRFLGSTGYVSDDTEQSALVAQSLVRHPTDPTACAEAFRRSLLGWFVRLPWGIGLATLRACGRIACGFARTGVNSAGNGAAMRAAIVGAFLCDRPRERQAFSDALARVTHTDPRAVEGARFVGELAAVCARSNPPASAGDCFRAAFPETSVVPSGDLSAALTRAALLASRSVPTVEAAADLGTTGFVIHTVPFAAFCFLRFGDRPLEALQEAISAGGDTDTTAAILGGWLGALHGEHGLPADLISRIHDGPFGPSHLRALGAALADLREGRPVARPSYFWPAAMVRNLALYPVVLLHGLGRLIPEMVRFLWDAGAPRPKE